MSVAPESSADNIAPLLRLGLEDESPLEDPNGTVLITTPAPPTGGSPNVSSRGWNPPSLEQLQKLLPQYEISTFIARGGMGAVYKGQQKTLKRQVAIKVLPPDLEDGDLQFAARFKHEAQAMAHLSHPNIVAVFDAGETPDGLLYFVMEFIEGTDVAQLIASEGQLDPRRAIQITTAVCEALAFAHEEGIIHRDIKPSNIMIDRKGRVKVADFGLAKTVNLEHSLMTGSNMALGTPDFIAPETLIPGIKVDGRADIYAVGVMLYQMLTGHIPRGRFELPSGVVPQMDKGFDAVVDKAMQTDREKRYSTAMEMKTAVEKVGSGQPKEGSAKKAEATTPRNCEANTAAPLPSVQPNRRTLIIAAAVVVVSVVAFLAMRKPVTSAGEEAMKLGGAVADATALPPGQWTKVWQKPGALPDFAAVSDGWVTTKEGRLGIRAPGFNGKNGGIRARFRRGPAGAPPPQLQLRNANGTGYNIRPEYNALIFRRNAAAAAGGNVELKKMPVHLPKAGQEYVLEFIAIGQTLIARLDAQTVSIQLDAGDHADLRGEASLFQTDVNAFRDVEVINLDGFPEAEALKLAGVTTNDTPAWQDMLHESAKLTLTGAVARVPDGLLFTDEGAARLSQEPRRNGGIRMRATFGGTHFSLRARKGDGVYELSPTNGKEIVLRRATITSIQTKLGVFPLPEPLRNGQDYELELRIIGDRLSAFYNGTLLGTITDGTYAKGAWEVASSQHGGAPALVKSLQAFSLDGSPEPEVLKLARLDASPNVSGASDRAATLAANPANWVDQLKKRQWEAPWVLENGVLKLTGDVKSRSHVMGILQDGAVRVRARLTGGTDRNLQLVLRAGGNVRGKPDFTGTYQIQVTDNWSACNLTYRERHKNNGESETHEMLWREELLPAAVLGQTDVEWEFRAVGDELSAWANGKLVASARDSRVLRGSVSLFSGTGMELTRVETIDFNNGTLEHGELVGPAKVSASPPVSPSPSPQISATPGTAVQWHDWLAESEKAGQMPPHLIKEAGGWRIKETNRGSGGSARFHADFGSPQLKDVAIRVTYVPSESAPDRQVFLVVREDSDRQSWPVSFNSVERRWILKKVKDRMPSDLLALPPMPEPQTASLKSRTAELRMVGATLSFYYNGTLLGSTDDATPATGQIGFSAPPGALIQKVEWADFSSIPKADRLKLAGVDAPASKPTSPASTSALWQPAFGKPLEQLATTNRKRIFQDDWLTMSGGLPNAPVAFGRGMARVRLGWMETTRTVKLGLQETEIELDLSVSGMVALHRWINGGIESGAPTLQLPAALKPGAELNLRIAWVNDRLYGWVDDQLIGSVPFLPAKSRVAGVWLTNDKDNQQVRLRDFEVLSLDGLSEAEALKLAGVSADEASASARMEK